MRDRYQYGAILCGALISFLCVFAGAHAIAAESLIIEASPGLKGVLGELATSFERSHPDIRVKLHFNTGLMMRQGIAARQNSMTSQFFIEEGPVHLVAPGGDELISRLEMKYYILPGTKRTYAKDQLVLVVPELLVDAPESLEALSRSKVRLAVAEPGRTHLGIQTEQALRALGLASSFSGRLDEATDSRGVLDHVLGGQAEAGIIYGHEAVRERERLRVVAIIKEGYEPTVHSMAMERYCPNRDLCKTFLDYLQSAEAQSAVRRAGYGLPGS